MRVFLVNAQELATLIGAAGGGGGAVTAEQLPPDLGRQPEGDSLSVVLGTEDRLLFNPLRSVGFPYVLSATIANNTSVYAAGDTIGGLITFTDALRAVGRGLILQRFSYIAPVDNLDLALILWRAQPTSHPADNAAFVWSATNRAKWAGVDVALPKVRSYSDGAAGVSVTYTADLSATPFWYDVNADVYATIVNLSGTPTFGSSSAGTALLAFTQE